MTEDRDNAIIVRDVLTGGTMWTQEVALDALATMERDLAEARAALEREGRRLAEHHNVTAMETALRHMGRCTVCAAFDARGGQPT